MRACVHIDTVYKEILAPPPPPPPHVVSFVPFCPCCLRINLRLGEFHCFNLSLFTNTVSRRIQDGAKLLASIEGLNLYGAKITLYTVICYTIHLITLYEVNMVK